MFLFNVLTINSVFAVASDSDFKTWLKSYKKIEPSINEFKKFIEDVVLVTKKNLVITTGLENNYLIDEIKSELDLVNNNIFKKHFNSNSIFLFNETNKIIL